VVSGVRLKLHDLFRSGAVSLELSRALGHEAYLTDWTRLNANFFRAVDIEKRMMFFIVFLIIAVAAFNIVSSLFMAVKDKQADIAILRTLGASRRQILLVNATEYFLLGALSCLAGTGLSVAGAWALARFSFQIPFEVNWLPLVLTFVSITFLTVLIGLLNSREVVSKPPLEVLRE